MSLSNRLLEFISILGLITYLLLCSGTVGVSGYELSHDPDQIKYVFFPKTGDSKEILLNKNETIDASFSKDKATVVLIHGFWSKITDDMPKLLIEALLDPVSNISVNVLVVDWEMLANTKRKLEDDKSSAFLEVVTDNIPIVAERTAKVLLWLKSLGLVNLANLHIIGHSLGAHTSGRVGSILKNETGTKVKRISGLDPAGPGFELNLGFINFRDYQRKLNPEDAEFVDIYHTNMQVKGDTSLDGHVDFYPNGGMDQPQCTQLDIFGTCEHGVVVKYYEDTIRGKNYTACACIDRKDDPGLECKPDCDAGKVVSPGYFLANTVRGQYHFDTSI